jgi:hypothetical protein
MPAILTTLVKDLQIINTRFDPAAFLTNRPLPM